jgi:phosphocarrier protein HPr
MMDPAHLAESDCPPVESTPDAVVRELPIINRKGLHARATAKFVQCVDRYDAQVKVTRCGETVGGDSIMGILTLGAGVGSTITVAATGPQAIEAVEALAALVAARFGEDE